MPRDRVSSAIAAATRVISAGIPRRGQTNRLREHRGARAGEAVHGFVERNDRNAEARVLDEVALNGVDALRVGARQVTR